jgi:excisionase family DNA binding protein
LSTRQRKLSRDEISAALGPDVSSPVPAILSPEELASVVGLSIKTIYDWIAKGRLDGAFRKRGKHNLIWRDRALDLLFNGPEWTNDTRK